MRRDRERLADILELAEKLERFARAGRERFDADEGLQIILTHLTELIGEAVAGLSHELRAAYPEVPWRQIVAARNRIIHGYFDVDLDIVWRIATRRAPALREQVAAIVDDLESGAENDS